MATKKSKKQAPKKTGRPSLGESANTVPVRAKVKAATAQSLADEAAMRGESVSQRLRAILEERYA